jgi:hypothetical protein
MLLAGLAAGAAVCAMVKFVVNEIDIFDVV